MIIFTLMGVWHGASWPLIISGVYNGILLVFENITKINRDKPGFFYNIIRHIYTLFAIVLGVLWFRTGTLEYSKDFILNLFGLLKTNASSYNIFYYVNKVELLVILIALICTTPIYKNILFEGEKNKFIGIIVDIWVIILLILSCMQIAASTYNPFIYFRF